MQGLTSTQAKDRLVEVLKMFKMKNKKQPVRNARFYATKIWTFEVLVYFYGLFLFIDYFLLTFSIESLVTGLFLLMLPLRYVYYKANKSKFQWEIFDERIDRILNLIDEWHDGEDMSDINLRTMNYTLADVNRDGKWVKLPSVVLVTGDLVRLYPGMSLPAPAYILDGGLADKVLDTCECLPNSENTSIIEGKFKTHVVMKDSPSKIILEALLYDRGMKKKKTPTFFMVSLKQSRKVFLYFFICLICLNIIFTGVWSYISKKKFNEILLNPTYLFLFLTIVILPSLVHLLNCWGNALLWCICEYLRNDKVAKKHTRKVQHLESIFENTERPGNIWSTPLAEKAESAFENEEMVSFFPPVSIFQCFSKCSSFLIGGLQRDLNILDLMSSSTVMSFIDKDGVISENSRYADEVIVMGPEGKILAFDLVHQSPQEVKSNNCEHDQMTFIGKTWEEHLNSLKPLGLATSVSRNPRIKDTYKNLINLNEDCVKQINTGELFFNQAKDETEIFEECACIIGKLTGFTNEAIDEYYHKCTLWSTWRPNECESLHDVSYRRIKKGIANKEYALSDYIEKRISQARRISAIQQRLLKPCHLLTSIVEKDGRFEVFSQGNPKVVLQNCKNYWEGGDIQVLEEDVLQQLNTALLQWTADDYDAIGFSYRPLDEEIEKIIKEREDLVEEDLNKDLLQGVQREHIFLGMIAVTNHPKSEANHFIEDVFDAGIRFVIFSEGDILETKAFGDDLGLYTAWNSCISLSDKPAVIEEFLNQDGKKVLPNGIEEIKSRLSDGNDNVPLLVSMFSDSTKSNILEMVKIYQQNGEVPIVIGNCLHPQNAFIYQSADISISVKTLNCGYCKFCFGYRINYKHNSLILEQVAENLISLPCTFTLNIEHPLYVILQIVKESRKLMKNIQNGLMFSANMFVCWSLLSCILLIFGLPPVVSLLQCIFICVFLIPLLALSFLSTPCQPSLMKKYPIKVDILLEVIRKDKFFTYLAIKVLIFIVIVVQTHVWGLSFQSDSLGFFSLDHLDNKVVIVQICNFLCGVVFVCIYSSCYVNSFQSWLQVRSLSNWIWLGVVVMNLISCLVICTIYLIVYDLFEELNTYLTRAWYVYLITCIEFLIVFIILEALNYGISCVAKGMQKTLEVYFQTKLGVYSPR